MWSLPDLLVIQQRSTGSFAGESVTIKRYGFVRYFIHGADSALEATTARAYPDARRLRGWRRRGHLHTRLEPSNRRCNPQGRRSLK